MQKNHIEKIWIEKQVDEYPDTSFIGEYTDKKEDWVICRRCGEFIGIAEQGNRRQEEIDEEIYNLENQMIYDNLTDIQEREELNHVGNI